MLKPNRRDILRLGLFATAMPAFPALSAPRAEPDGTKPPCGLVIHSFAVRTGSDRSLPRAQQFAEPHRFLAHARKLRAKGVQVGLGPLDDAQAAALRNEAEAAGMFLEGIAALPRDEADLDRFRAELRAARAAGADVVRTVMLSGRRYETFTSAAAFRSFAEQAAKSLALAAKAAASENIRLAVENHKDWRADELIALLKKHGNDHVGVCLDTGNSIALLEDPMEVIDALAALAFTTHFKDMAVEPHREGFLLSEVPLGTGILDLPRAVRTIRAANPGIRFNLEMITRDPLLVPCLTPGYWETFSSLPAAVLARSLRLIRDHASAGKLPRIKSLPAAEQLAAEDRNLDDCLRYANQRLGLMLG